MTEDEMIKKAMDNAKHILTRGVFQRSLISQKDMCNFVDFIVSAAVLQAKSETLKVLNTQKESHTPETDALYKRIAELEAIEQSYKTLQSEYKQKCIYIKFLESALKKEL